MEVNTDPGMLFEAENEDDVFYAEIKRQILQLTTEEDNEGFLGETKRLDLDPVMSHGVSKGSGSGYVFCRGVAGGSHFCSWEAQSYGGSPPVWLVNLWKTKNGKGTGVFIPQAVRSKKYHRSGTDCLWISVSF